MKWPWIPRIVHERRIRQLQADVYLKDQLLSEQERVIRRYQTMHDPIVRAATDGFGRDGGVITQDVVG